MAKSKSTTAMGKEHEEAVVRLFEWDAASRSKSSGASFHDPVDVTTNSMVIECECTEADSYSLKKEFWKEVVSKQHSGKLPTLAIRFRDPYGQDHIDLIIQSAHDVSEERELLDALRHEALNIERKKK